MPGRRRKRRGILGAPLAAAALTAALAVLAGGAPGAGADLQARIETVKQDAQALEAQIQARGEQIAALETETTEAEARIVTLTGELRAGEERSNQLAAELTAAERQLAASRARLKRARGVLAERLVEIYKGGEVDYLELLLTSRGFDDLTTRAEYLRAIENADSRVADRVHELAEAVQAEVERIAALKTEIDRHNRELVASRREVAQTRAELQRQRAELQSARAQEQSDLGEMRTKIEDLLAQVSRNQVAQWFGDWAIPGYIVMCESGGNYHALNPSSGAGGAYQILPSTWAGYGGQGLPHQAPKAEQDRIAAQIWANSGPGQWACA